MKKALLILLLLICIQPLTLAANPKMPPVSEGENLLPNIFIYSFPDDTQTEEKTTEQTIPENNIVTEEPLQEGEEITLELDNNIILGASTLKGYTQYVEDTSKIHLKDENNNFILNIKEPQKISSSKGLNLKKQTKPTLTYTDAEYVIAPNSIKSSSKIGNFTIGAMYKNEVDNIAMLETETGLFTKYEKSRFALSSTVKKSLNTTYAQDYNTVSVAPELKLNNYMSLKNVLSADITRNRRASEVVFQLNPYGQKDTDRLMLELGAKQTFYLDNDTSKTQFSFSTIFKL